MAETLMESATTTNDGEQTSTEEAGASTSESTETKEQTTETTETVEQQGAPEKYEFTAQEGQEFDPEVIKVYSEVAKELNLNQENAQKLLDKMSPIIQQQNMAKIEAVRNEWAESAKIDKEYGGDKLKENLAVAKTALDKFGSPELKELINQTGLGNHPEMIRFFYRAGKAIAPDNIVTGHKEGEGVPKDFNSQAEKLYGT